MRTIGSFFRPFAVVAGLLLVPWAVSVASADHTTPGNAGQTKVYVYDNTQNGWNVTTDDPGTGGPDPVIGFVNFRPTVPGDPTHIKFVVILQDAAPNCGYSFQLIPQVFDPSAGLAPDGTRTGSGTAWLGDIWTNKKGHASATFVADATLLPGTAPSGQITYAHIDIEDVDGDCVEKDGTSVEENEYGASGKPPGSDYDLPVNLHWLQP